MYMLEIAKNKDKILPVVVEAHWITVADLVSDIVCKLVQH